jgi:hypothetical protein
MLLDKKTNFLDESVPPLTCDVKGRENFHSYIRVSKTFKRFLKNNGGH